MRELHVQPCSAALVPARSTWSVPPRLPPRCGRGALLMSYTSFCCRLMLGCVRRPGVEPGVSRVSGERRDRLARGGWSTRQVPPLVPPVCRTGALLVSYASMGTMVSGTDQSRTDHLRGFRPALFQLSYSPRCPVPQANVRQERAGGGSRTRSSWVEARCAATSTSPAGQSNWSGWPDSNRHRRVGNAQLWPLSYTHMDAETGFAPVRDCRPTALQAAAFGYSATRRWLRRRVSNPRSTG